MAADGWEGEMQFSGTISFGSVPEAQQALFNSAQEKCVSETGWGDLAGLGADKRRKLYEQEVSEYECLMELGLTPPAPPTEQTYVDTFNTADQYYAGATLGLTEEQVQECPPPTWFMNW
jgi:hypothetical protein